MTVEEIIDSVHRFPPEDDGPEDWSGGSMRTAVAEIERLREALAKISRLPNSGERSSGDYAKIAIDALAGGEES